MDEALHNPKCAAMHITDWAVEPSWFGNAFSAVRSGVWQAALPENRFETGFAKSLKVDDNGIAFIGLDGPLMKGWSKYGGTSTVGARAMLREAARRSDVTAVMLVIDSPGGTVSGTEELGREIARVNESTPVYAHIDDLGASAAYWAASAARRITANRTASVGSIGVYTVLEDLSGAAQAAGIKVHVVSSGGMKGAGLPGTEITDEILAETQKRIDGINAEFVAAVAAGRNLSKAQAKGLADGRVHLASEAKSLGLIDAVADLSAAYQTVVNRHVRPRAKSAKARLRETRLS